MKSLLLLLGCVGALQAKTFATFLGYYAMRAALFRAAATRLQTACLKSNPSPCGRVAT